MLKYLNTAVTFAEFPDEISLCINITGCKIKCQNCHSSYLSEDIGSLLTMRKLKELIESNKGITCIGFMGGDIEPHYINTLAQQVKESTDLKVGWYSGRQELDKYINPKWFDYIKLGPYIEEKGSLNNPNTNQKMYKVEHNNGSDVLINITNKFWK